MPPSLSSQIDFVLVRPQFAGNAGAAARALKNTGFKNLILVDPAFSKGDPDLKFAVGAKDLIEKAPVHRNLFEILDRYAVVLGTSRREGAYRKNRIGLFELPALLERLGRKGRVALLFGTEADGLSNEELELCQHLIYIPADPRFESFNLAQAVLLTAYELFRSQLRRLKKEKVVYPSAKDLEGMYAHLTEMLLEIGFMRKSSPHHMPRILRNILSRAHLTDPELRVIRGICRQVLWYRRRKQE
jgi:TrmH family RNA methyltransferase